ncbi:unnamed protein product [Rangifer tarandus platyrhynchus]|uniref:Uncharacterized protein n=2 Tax=Rangifer tarandus platyrhynchus TaxID=3082113 RepID=A0ABN8ZVP9_RANTA|nr:unnamed protein product [Rangifer tarandus platyrhynchus]CAI9711684.1 unnamed protein product [Rangifer tarandus platyrhynchus]
MWNRPGRTGALAHAPRGAQPQSGAAGLKRSWGVAGVNGRSSLREGLLRPTLTAGGSTGRLKGSVPSLRSCGRLRVTGKANVLLGATALRPLRNP